MKPRSSWRSGKATGREAPANPRCCTLNLTPWGIPFKKKKIKDEISRWQIISDYCKL